MAIQNRRGLKANFNANKMLPGEFAFCTDTGEIYYCYSAGNVKRLTTVEEVQTLLGSSQEAYTALQQLIADLQEQTVLTGILADIDALQNGKLDKTGDSKDNTVTFAEASTDTNIASGETHTTLFGKLLKNIKTLRSLIGTLANLTTTEKSNLVGAINEIVGQYGKKIDINNSGYDQNTRGLRTVTNANINEVAHTGDYYCVGGTNRPVEVNGMLTVKAQDYDTIWQIYTPYTSEIIYTRKKVLGSGWQAWKKITPVAL